MDERAVYSSCPPIYDDFAERPSYLSGLQVIYGWIWQLAYQLAYQLCCGQIHFWKLSASVFDRLNEYCHNVEYGIEYCHIEYCYIEYYHIIEVLIQSVLSMIKDRPREHLSLKLNWDSRTIRTQPLGNMKSRTENPWPGTYHNPRRIAVVSFSVDNHYCRIGDAEASSSPVSLDEAHLLRKDIQHYIVVIYKNGSFFIRRKTNSRRMKNK